MSRLGRLLRPRHIAVFGGNWAESVVEQALRMGFGGPVWPVHPRRSEIGGLPCFPSVESLPSAPDASFLGVNRHLTGNILAQLSDRGAGGAICFASGFAESLLEDVDGKRLQEQLVEAAGDMPFLGPNCYGLVNYLDRTVLWPDQHGGLPCDSGVAFVSQSSNVAINFTMQTRGVPVACVVTVGNQAKISQAAVALELLEDPRITAIALHIEGFGDLREYEALSCRAKQLKKPLVAIKAGRSAEANAATISHTGAIAGSDDGAAALLKRLGIARVHSLPVMLETLKLLHNGGPLSGRRIGSLSCSGGEACLIADAVSPRRLQFGEIGKQQEQSLGKALGPMVHIANPLDYHTYEWGNREALQRIFTAMLAGSFDLTFLVIDFPRTDRCADLAWEPAVQAIINARKETGARVAAVSSLPENMPENWSRRFADGGIAALNGIDEAAAAAETAADIADNWQTTHPPLLLPARNSGRPRRVEEPEAKAILASYGLAIPASLQVNDLGQLASAASTVGYPVVLKGCGIAHKSDEGAVALDLRSANDVEAAADRMQGVTGFLVERYVENTVAEILIGVVRDEAHGFVLTVGAGGQLAELMGDARHFLLPVSRSEIDTELKRLHIWPLLSGYRGTSAGDIDAVIDAILALGEFAAANADCLVEVEINPFLVQETGGYAADALLVLAD